jgi:hypothetical protein
MGIANIPGQVSTLMGVTNILGQVTTWKRCFPNGLRQVQNEGMPMQLKSKESEWPRIRMVHDTATAMSTVKPALRTHPANCMMVSSAMDVSIGFTLLALVGKSMDILPMDTWNPKCIQTSKYHWVHCRKKTPSRGILHPMLGKQKV